MKNRDPVVDETAFWFVLAANFAYLNIVSDSPDSYFLKIPKKEVNPAKKKMSLKQSVMLVFLVFTVRTYLDKETEIRREKTMTNF